MTSQFRGALSVSILALFVAASVNASELVWIGSISCPTGAVGCIPTSQVRLDILDESATPVEHYSSPGPIGGMTRVGSEVWVGIDDTNEILRMDFSGNVVGTIPPFTTESTGGMTTVGNEVWWGSADSTTILRLDFSGSVLGSVDGGFLNVCPTGGMVTIGDEVWRGPNEECVLGGALLRFDLAGNWLGTMSDPTPGLVGAPLDEGTGAMTRVGNTVWWISEVSPTNNSPSIYGIDASGMSLGYLASGFPALIYKRGMATVPGPTAVPSMHPIALYALVPGLLVGVGLMAMRRRR